MGDQVDELDELLPAHCANAYLDTWDRHLSIAFSNTKGLRNAPGENNCFVNCAVQVFWHLDVFRRSYRRLSGHTCMGNSCIFCALKVIFTQFQYSDKTSLHPDALRKALAETFANQHRFQLGHMDDAAECFENILRRLHFHVASNYNEDTCSAPHCLPHQKFSMAVQEKVVCVCGASTSPLKFHEMVHYVSSSALLAQSRADQNRDGTSLSDRFGLLLRRASAMGDVRNCPASCGKQVQKQRTLLNIPDVVSVGLVWDSDRPSEEMTTQVARILGTTIVLPDMFHHVQTDPNKLPCLQLVAVVCYYGKHYSTFVFHSKLKTWIYFDDATVREIGPKWSNVVDKCSRGRFQPLLLLYANDSAVPISVDTAPQRRVMAAGYSPVGSPDGSESRLDRTHESIKSMGSSSRHPTPNPDHPSQHGGHYGPALDDTGRDSPARLGRDHIRQPSFLTAVAKDRTKQADTAEGAGTLPGGAAAYKPNGRRPLLDGGANSGHLNPMVEEGRDYCDYTLSSGGQYRRPLPVEPKKPLPMPPNISRGADDPRKAPWKKAGPGKDMSGVDVVRYQVDPNRSHRSTPDFSVQQGGGNWAGGQHVVVKPTPTAHAKRDSADCSSLTPVQSGLATLPRQRGHGHHGEAASRHPSTSSQREGAPLSHRSVHSNSSLHCALPPGTPPPEYDSVIGGPHPSHTRQTSSSSQASSLRSSVSMGNLHQLGSGKLSESQQSRNVRNDQHSTVPQRPDKGQLEGSGEREVPADKSRQYIDRRMVESILKHQGVHRNGSSCSNSSVESDSVMGKLMAKKSATSALRVDIPADTLSLSSLKDSGCGSSDRHSSGSPGSGSVDQFPQYLLNKSMIVPKSINAPHQTASDHQTAPYLGKGHQDSRGPSPRPGQGVVTHEGCPKIMHPIKESSQEEAVQRTSPTEPIGTQKFILAPPAQHANEARPPPIPPKNFAQFQIIKSSHSQSPTPHDRESSLDNLIKEEPMSSSFVSLCKKADVLMDRCAMAETKQDVSSALHCGEGALGCLKEAMTHKELNSKAKAYLQKKHSSCLLKVRSLQKRAPASRQESHSSGIGSDITSSVGNSRSSITSSDSDLSDQVLKHSRQVGRPAAPPVPRPRLAPHPSPVPQPNLARATCGQGTVHVPPGQSVDSKNSYRGSVSTADSHDGHHDPRGLPRRGVQPPQPPLPSRPSHSRTDSCNSSHAPQSHGRTDSCNSSHAPQSHGRTDSCNSSHPPHSYGRTDNTGGANTPSSLMSEYVSVGSVSGGDSSADLYGTLPRNKSRKPGSETAASAEMYQSFLSKQKSLQAEVSLSQQSLDSVRSDTGSDAGNKMNKTQIRQLLQDSIVQRQWHQPSSVHNHPMQHSSAVQQSNPSQQTAYRSVSQSGQSVGHYGQQTVPSAASQRSTSVQHASASSHVSQHQQRQPHPAGYQHSSVSEQAAAAAAVPGSRAPTPGTVSAGRPRTPSCQASANTGCSNPSGAYTSSVSSHCSSGTGKSSAPQNVARVVPYSHLMDGQPMRCSGSSYLVMMHPSQQHPPASAARGNQEHSSSGSQQAVAPASKPLTRSASQSDCRTLSNRAHAPSLSDQGASFSNTTCKKSSSALSVANCSEHPHSPGSPPSPQSSPSASDGPHADVADTPVNVRSLLSRFERTDVANSQTPCPRVAAPSHPQGPLKRDSVGRASGRAGLRRTRSKSESSSTKPKSVLKKTRMKSRPRKSVTFAESIAHFADCDDANSGYESATELSSSQVTVDSRLNCSDDELRLSYQGRLSDSELYESTSSSSDDCPEEEEETCRLCHRRRSSSGQAFCAKCSFYLAKLNLS